MIRQLIVATLGGLIAFQVSAASSFGSPLDPKNKDLCDVACAQSIIKRNSKSIADFFSENGKAKNSKLVEEILDKDVRKMFFRIQVITRLYLPLGNQYIADLRKESKLFEDLIGAIDLYDIMFTEAIAMEEPRAADLYADLKKEAVGDLIKNLENYGYLNQKPKRKSLILSSKDLKNESNWKFPKSEKSFFVKNLINDMNSLQKDLMDNKFDDADIEIGLHELKRRIRWINLAVTSLDGFVLLVTEEHLPDNVSQYIYEKEQGTPEQPSSFYTNKYVKLGDPQVTHPLYVPKGLFAILGDVYSQSGKFKDKLEIPIEFEHLIKENTKVFTDSDRDRILDKAYSKAGLERGEIGAHRELSRELTKTLLDLKLFELLGSYLNSMN